MCNTCGCEPSEVHTETFHFEKNLLEENDHHARHNQEYFNSKNITTLNMVASPGSGKTSLLEITAQYFENKNALKIIVGDQATENDANRLKQHGIEALQIFTDKVCHLDAHMISHALEKIETEENSFLIIENVGNLICPAMFSLGEHQRVVLLSVTEGEDKPLKYPHMFGTADLVILTKIDLLPYLDFDMEQCIKNIKTINPKARIIPISAKNKEGIDEWLDWLAIHAVTDAALQAFN